MLSFLKSLQSILTASLTNSLMFMREESLQRSGRWIPGVCHPEKRSQQKHLRPEWELSQGRAVCPFCPVLCPQCLEQCLTHSRHLHNYLLKKE